MKLLKLLDCRPIGAYKVRFALFECPFCKSTQELRKTTGLLKQSCGCVRGVATGDNQDFWNEVERLRAETTKTGNEFLELLRKRGGLKIEEKDLEADLRLKPEETLTENDC